MRLWGKLILLMSVWRPEDMFATEGECCYNVSYTKISGNELPRLKSPFPTPSGVVSERPR